MTKYITTFCLTAILIVEMAVMKSCQTAILFVFYGAYKLYNGA